MKESKTTDALRDEFIQACMRLFARALTGFDTPVLHKLQEDADELRLAANDPDILAGMASFIHQVLAHAPLTQRQIYTAPLHTAIDKMIPYYASLPADISMPAECVDLLSWYANQDRNPDTLLYIHSWMARLIDTRSQDLIRREMHENPASPWRILLFNLAIVATRTYQPDLIRSAYTRIAELLPHESMEFFTQAMEQMDLIGYPEPVRKVVQEFYQRNQPYDTRH